MDLCQRSWGVGAEGGEAGGRRQPPREPHPVNTEHKACEGEPNAESSPTAAPEKGREASAGGFALKIASLACG